MYGCMYGCMYVRLFRQKFLWISLYVVWGTSLPFGACFKPKKLTCPTTPAPFLGYFGVIFPETLGVQVSAHLRLSGLDFYVSGIFMIIPRVIFFVWPNFDFWALGRESKWGSPGVVQKEFLQTWSCYISSESIFDADFEFPICLAMLGPGVKVVVSQGSPKLHR